MTQWSEIQERAKKLIDEGIVMLRSGIHDAEFLAETTASAAKLHMDAGKNRMEQYRTLHDIGLAVYKMIEAHPGHRTIELTDEMNRLLETARGLEESSENGKQKLSRFSVVKKNTVSVTVPRDPSLPRTKTQTRYSTKKRNSERRNQASRSK